MITHVRRGVAAAAALRLAACAVALFVAELLALTSPAWSQVPTDSDLARALGEEIPRLMRVAIVPGLTAAVIRDGEIVWARGFGVRSVETGEPVDEETIFEAASMTKPVTAYVAMRLVERELLDLDAPLAGYLREERYEDDEGRYERLTARHVLTHTTGLPNWGSEFEAEPGERYGYSGEGFAYLGRVMEELTGTALEALVEREVFAPLGMTRSGLVWFEECELNGASGHDNHGFPEERRRFEEANGGGSMATTASDYARFLIALMDAQGLSEQTVDGILTPQVPVTEWESGEPNARVSWGLGWGLEPTESGQAYWHWGNNVDVQGYAVADRGTRTGVVYFANGGNGLMLAQEIVGLVTPEPQWALEWLNVPRYDAPEVAVRRRVEMSYLEWGREAGYAKLLEAQEGHPDIVDPHFMAEVASLLSEQEVNGAATEVLARMVTSFPDSADSYAYRGEALMEGGEYALALEDFEHALELAPAHEHATERIDWVREAARAQANPLRLPTEILERYAGDYGARHITLRDGALYYRRDDRDEYRLYAMDETTFGLAGLHRFRMRFEIGEDGRAEKIIGIYMGGRTDESERDE